MRFRSERLPIFLVAALGVLGLFLIVQNQDLVRIMNFDSLLYARYSKDLIGEIMRSGIPDNRISRLLPLSFCYFTLKGLGLPVTDQTVFNFFETVSLISITASAIFFFKISEELQFGLWTRVFVFFGIFVNACVLKNFFEVPVMTDASAFLIAWASLYCYLHQKQKTILWLSVVASFCWPTAVPVNALFLLFPFRGPTSLRAERSNLVGIASGSALAMTHLIYALLAVAIPWVLYEWIHWRIGVEPTAPWGLSNLVRMVWERATERPGIFLVSHTYQLGPIYACAVVMSRGIFKRAWKAGPAMVLILLAFSGFSFDSETRHLLYFLPPLAILICCELQPYRITAWTAFFFSIASVVVSRVWKMTHSETWNGDGLVIRMAGEMKGNPAVSKLLFGFGAHQNYFLKLTLAIVLLISALFVNRRKSLLMGLPGEPQSL